MSSVKRKYESPKRRRQAEDTRRRLAASARRLFAERGYGATSIESIARDAGVAVQTFYATYGSKRGVLLALRNDEEAQAARAALLAALRAAAGDPRLQLRHAVDYHVAQYTRIADVLEIIRAAGTTDPDLASLRAVGERTRREAQARVVGGWARAGALAPGLSRREAVDVLWALTSPEIFRLFVHDRGWDAERYRAWLTATLEQALFGTRVA